MALIDYYISQISQNKLADKQGSTHSCFLFQSYALLKGIYNKTDMPTLIEKSEELKKQGVSVVPTLDYKIESTHPEYPNLFKGYVLQRKAKGTELYPESFAKLSAEEYQSRIDELAQRPQKFFDKYVSDWIKINKSGLVIDPSKSSNFFYTPEEISFIDLNVSHRKDNLKYAFMESSAVLFNNGAYYKCQDKEKHKIILNKMVNAFIKQGENIDTIKQTAQNMWPEIAQYALKDIQQQPAYQTQSFGKEIL